MGGQKNDHEGETESHDESASLLEKIGHNSNTMYTHILYDLALSHYRIGAHADGRTTLEKANAVFDNNPKLRSSNRAGSLQAIADSQSEFGDLKEALISYQLARDVHEQMGTLKSDGGKQVVKSLESMRKRLGDAIQVPMRKMVTFESEYLQLRRTRPSPTR